MYPDGTIGVENVSLVAGRGTVTAVLGANASGKTTLILLLAGLLKPTSGMVTYGGKPLVELGWNYRKICGVLFQNPEDQLIAPIVYEDIAIGPRQLGMQVEDAVTKAASETGVKPLLKRYTHRLSGGQKKKVALAGILAYRPRILLLDEPFAGLDWEGYESLTRILRSYREKRRIALFTTQDSDIAFQLADKIAVLKEGRVIALLDGGVKPPLELVRRAGVKPPIDMYSKLQLTES